jgi:hypothetical protein
MEKKGAVTTSIRGGKSFSSGIFKDTRDTSRSFPPLNNPVSVPFRRLKLHRCGNPLEAGQDLIQIVALIGFIGEFERKLEQDRFQTSGLEIQVMASR